MFSAKADVSSGPSGRDSPDAAGYCRGSGQILDDTVGSVNGDFAYPAVPEPTSAASLGVGLFGALIARRKRVS